MPTVSGVLKRESDVMVDIRPSVLVLQAVPINFAGESEVSQGTRLSPLTTTH